MISFSLHPSTRSAPTFQRTILPSASTMNMA